MYLVMGGVPDLGVYLVLGVCVPGPGVGGVPGLGGVPAQVLPP